MISTVRACLFATMLFIAGCSNTLVTTEFGNVSDDVKKECAMAVLLPERDLSMSEVEEYWTQDRIELAKCRGKHKELVTVIEERTKK